MKKAILTLVASCIGVSLFAQGTVNFGNIGTGTAISNITTLLPVPSGTQFKAALYYLPDQVDTPTAAAFDQARNVLGATVTSFSLAGQFAGGTRTTPPSTPGAGFAWFQVRAWSAAYATYEDAIASGLATTFAGTSAALRSKTGDPANAVPPVSLVSSGLKGFYVVPVPEPAAIGLGLLGIGALVLLRRRK